METPSTPVAPNTILIQVEVTDTFGGEANYSWVRRRRFHIINSPRNIVRVAKRFAGLTGMRCSVDSIGGGCLSHAELIEIRPTGKNAPCITCFVTIGDDEFVS